MRAKQQLKETRWAASTKPRTRLRRQRIGFAFQAFRFLPYLALHQRVALSLAPVLSDALAASVEAEAILVAAGLEEE